MRAAHLNLAGDGDEIAAVDEVEREFGIRIDTSRAGGWFTVGNVYDALLLSLPDYLGKQPTTWRRFCHALCLVTGDDPQAISREMSFIGPVWGLSDLFKGAVELMNRRGGPTRE